MGGRKIQLMMAVIAATVMVSGCGMERGDASGVEGAQSAASLGEYARLVLDAADGQCFSLYLRGVQEVYLRQQGNPNLFLEEEPGVVDCLHRIDAVPTSYTVDQYKAERRRYDRFMTQRGQAEPPSVSEANGYFNFDLADTAVANCLVCNHSTLPGLTAAYQTLEWKPFG